MTTLRSAPSAGRTLPSKGLSWLLRGLLCRTLIWTVAFSLAWLQVSPSYAAARAAVREDARRAAWLRAHTPHVKLPPGLTQTPDAPLRAKIAAKQAAAKPVADVRPLSAKEMGHLTGRGPLRNPYFNGTLPWQRSLRDVNLCNGNLFKSFTDIQVAPARGAGLVLQRTYNSNDARIGPFGVGWTHAYDIRMQEAAAVQAESQDPAADGTADDVPRTDFFGAKHTYHRDADGLYTPPNYMFDETSSDYDSVLVNGPTKVMADTEKGEDGTIKHYKNVVTLADGTEGNERACDYIQDRYGNTTNLTYGQSYVQSDGSTRNLLTGVTDPSGRTLAFQWTNFGTVAQPAYRITETDAPTDPATGIPAYRVTYDYYTSASDPASGGVADQLKAVHLDLDGLNRTTTYTYASVTGTYYDQSGTQQTATETGLLQSIADPMGHAVSYTYASAFNLPDPEGGGTLPASPSPTGTLWVATVTEPAGVAVNGTTRTLTWSIFPQLPSNGFFEVGFTTGDPNAATLTGITSSIAVDQNLRYVGYGAGWPNSYHGGSVNGPTYDLSNNVVHTQMQGLLGVSVNDGEGSEYTTNTTSTYGVHGNVLTQTFDGFSPQAGTTYYNASQYFQKAYVTDQNGHTTAMTIGTSGAGTAGAADTNVGDRGQVLAVQDAGYNDPSGPSYQKQFTYTYNGYGQKTSETNLNGVVTAYTYGDQWGNLTQVVQDPGAGHLNRTTAMTYDVMGRVLTSVDPAGQTSTFAYNTLGQPLSVATPATSSAPAETITYAYDPNGRTHSVTDNRGTTTMAYENGSDRVNSVTDPVTGTTGYTYNDTGERLSMTLPGGGTWAYGYAAPNIPWPISYAKDDPNSLMRTLVSLTDDQGRIVTVNQGGPKSVYNGNLTGASGQLRQVSTNQTFDANGNVVSYCDTHYYYDRASYAGNINSTLSHGWLHRLTTTFWAKNGGVWAGYLLSENDYTYDNAGQRLTNTVTRMAPGSGGAPQYAGGAATYDGSGNATNLVTTTRVEKYQKPDGTSGYDALNRLTDVDYGDGQTQSYTFDAMGNRLSRQDSASGTTTSTYNAANMLLSSGGNAYTSDADGNTLTGGGRTNTWDSQNRLAGCTAPGPSTTFHASYTYGADGLRRRATTYTTQNSHPVAPPSPLVTDSAYDGTMLVREGTGNRPFGRSPLTPANVTATYLIGPRGPEYRRDDTAQETDSQGNSVTKARWYVYDGLGSVVGEVDPLGNLTSSPKYDVYGAVRANGGVATSRQGFVGSLGHVSDTETGLIYMRARYYDPNVGRFASEDTAGHGVNWFVYAMNSPVNQVDADGRINLLSTDIYLAMGVGLLSAALFMMGIAGRLTSYSQGLAQSRVLVQASACASLAAVCFAKAAIGCTIGASFLAAINNSLAWAMPMIFFITAGAASVGSQSPAWAAVGATYAYEIVVVGFIIATEAAEQTGA